MKICIDPGHGGHDCGAVGQDGLQEADINLDVSQRLARSLEAAGFQIKLTRSTDVFIQLSQRCTIANDWYADYFLSVHCNSDGPSAVGIETLYASEDGKDLALPIQSCLIAATGDRDRGLKHRSDLHVLNGTAMPAVLVEIGFISHPATEKKLATGDYRQLVGNAIASGLAEFLGIQALPAA